MDLSAAVESFSSAYTARRRPRTQYDANGRKVGEPDDVFTIQAVVQPVNARELQRLPEGLREKVRFQIFSTTEIRNKDLVAIGDENYEIDQTSPWGDLGNYWQGLALKTGN